MADRIVGKEHRCDECGADADIALPDRLIEDCHGGKLLLFVGSGASTEGHNVLGNTFYDQIRERMRHEESDTAFPDLMSAFVARFSRAELLTVFYERLRYIDSHPFFHLRATRFHRTVGQVPFFSNIITTNWDDYFETETGAVPLVHGPDFDYWDLNRRKVLKVHGSVLNPGSVIATREEYNRSLEALRSGALGTAARHLMATHSVVFVGYSMRDDDIKRVVEALREDLDTAARPVYFVNPNPAFDAPLSGARVLRTTAGRFIELVDEALINAGLLLHSGLYDYAALLGSRLREAKLRIDDRLPPWRFPLAMFNHSYQDGLANALDHTVAARRSGEDRRHHHLLRKARAYGKFKRRATARRSYWDAAYIEGYMTGLIALGAPMPPHEVPLYFCPGAGAERSLARVAKAIRGGLRTHAAAHAWAARQLKGVPKEMHMYHPPVLPSYSD